MCAAEILSKTQCSRCGSLLDNYSCDSCANEFGINRFRAICDYSDIRFWVAKRKRDIGNQELMFNPALMSNFYHNFLRNKEYSIDVEFVPSKSNNARYEHIFDFDDLLFSRVSLLVKRESIPQKLLKREERIAQKRKLFEIVENPSRKSDTVLLIDDVLSTGASLSGCISLLLGLGYKEVYAIVLSYQRMCSGDDDGYR